MLSIDTSRGVDDSASRRRDDEVADDDEPLSPTAQMYNDLYIVAVIGLATPIDVGAFRAGLEATFARHPRFCSVVRVMGDGGHGRPERRWVRTTVNLDDHVIVPVLDPAAVAADPDKALEDYVASLSTLEMDRSRPLWELHVLDFPTSEAASAVVFRIDHALGDGTSLISLLIASAAYPTGLPAMPSFASRPPAPATRRDDDTAHHGVYGASAGRAAMAFAAWVVSTVLLVGHTVVDAMRLVALVLGLVKDPQTVFTAVEGVEFRRKRFVSRGLSFQDVKHVKNALGCKINDVLVGVASAALSRYYFRKSGDQATKKGMFLRSIVPVNVRSTPGIQELAHMMESSKHNDVRWGNQIGQMILPFHIVMHDDPIEYVREAKKIVDRKKRSLEVMITHGIAKIVTKHFGIKVSGALFQRMISNTTIPISNMIGPVEKIELYGNQVVYIAPSVYGHPSALTIHWQSYADSIRVVLAVDDAQFPDCHQLLDDFTDSLKLIRDAT